MKTRCDRALESEYRHSGRYGMGLQHMNWPVRYPMPADLASSEQVEHRLPGCVSRFRQQKKKPTSRLE